MKYLSGGREADHLGARLLGAQQVGGEIGTIDRVHRRAQHLAAFALHHPGGVLLEGLSESVSSAVTKYHVSLPLLTISLTVTWARA